MLVTVMPFAIFAAEYTEPANKAHACHPVDADGKPVADSSTYARFKGFEKTTTGTNALITQVVRVGDAELRKSRESSGGDFGIVAPGGINWGDVAIKEIRVIQASLYD